MCWNRGMYWKLRADALKLRLASGRVLLRKAGRGSLSRAGWLIGGLDGIRRRAAAGLAVDFSGRVKERGLRRGAGAVGAI